MKRTAPMKRTALKASRPPPARPAKQIDYTPRPRAAATPHASVSPLAAPVPKFSYVRDKRLRAMCQSMTCRAPGCGSADGVTWAHSNQAVHGKGKSIKASDVYVAALCRVCHYEVDQGKDWLQERKVAVWGAAHARTIAEALRRGLWPAGVPVPGGGPDGEPPRPLRGRQATDASYLETMRGEPERRFSAQEMARLHGASWYTVSFALRRLAEKGLADEEVVDLAGKSRSVEHSRVYRAALQKGEIRQLKVGLPAWLAPQAIVAIGESRRILGSAGLGRRWGKDADEAGRQSASAGAPGGPVKGAASTKDRDASAAETAVEGISGG